MIGTSSTYCVDASLVSRIITGNVNREISSLVDRWNQNQAAFVAPDLLGYEIANILHRQRAAGLTNEMIRQALDALDGMSVEFVNYPEIHIEAMELAHAFTHPASYDAHYLAVSLRFGVEFWTCDRRLAYSANTRFNWVHFVDPVSKADRP